MSTLRELFQNNEENKEDCIWEIPRQLFEEFGEEHYSFDIDLYDDEIVEKINLKSCFVKEYSWICTDTPVGLKLIWWNDEPFAITTQSARKEDVNVYFFDLKKKMDLISLIQTLKERNSENSTIISIDSVFTDKWF